MTKLIISTINSKNLILKPQLYLTPTPLIQHRLISAFSAQSYFRL